MSIKSNYYFLLIPILLFLNFFIRIIRTNTISPDTYDYIEIAENLPCITNSTWPIFYPIILKTSNLFIQEYFLAVKVISFLMLLFTVLFVKIKNFYWKEIWILLCFFSFQRLVPLGLSEVILLPLSLLFLFFNHQYLLNVLSSKKFIFYNSITLIMLVLTKYSGLSFVSAFFLFTGYLFIKQKKYFNTYFKSLIIVILSLMIYFILNKIITGYFMGLRYPPDGVYYNVRLSLSQILFNLNPFFHTRLDNFLGLFSTNWELSYVFGIVFAILWGSIILINFNRIPQYIPIKILSLLCSFIFLIGTIYSYFITKIDILDFRLLCGFYIFLFFTVIVSTININCKKYDYILLMLGLFSILPQFLNLLIV